MPDRRFFAQAQPLTVVEAAAEWGEVVRGGETSLAGVAPLDAAGPGDLAFLSDRRLASRLEVTGARSTMSGATTTAARLFQALPALEAARPDEVCEDDSVRLAPGIFLGQGARIGRGSLIGPGTVIGPGVQIGRDARIGAHVSLFCALVGDRVTLLSGARIGEAGFGAAASPAGPLDVVQLGRVILQDEVTVGANSCIDRGAYDDTVIGEGTKIDNMVQIGHNCRIGRFCLMAAHTGVSGSVTVGDGVMFGGRSGIADHITIGEGARIAGGAGVLADVPAGETWSGYPAKPLRQSLREAVWLAKQAQAKTRGGTDGHG
ncbi:UDP-3-O-(3-hydroxymyristoyl)glucosamine N-acyltransferase [Brevundimonas sp.]|uniref:UDP-3-O-(3-hydroxymyristoyl)glucosamine N-acyltransferase n=1 Tax=Brevundimonas sp. TaxID=1871086 RepID=UPI0039199487